MSTEARAVHFPAVDWNGGGIPISRWPSQAGNVAFHRFRLADVFGAADGLCYLRASNVWPTPFPFYPSIVFSSVMTFCLLSSSLTMVFGVSASSKGDKARAQQVDTGDNLFRRGVHRAALDRMEPPYQRRPEAVLVCLRIGLRRLPLTDGTPPYFTVWRDLLHHHRPAHVSRRHRCNLSPGVSLRALRN